MNLDDIKLYGGIAGAVFVVLLGDEAFRTHAMGWLAKIKGFFSKDKPDGETITIPLGVAAPLTDETIHPTIMKLVEYFRSRENEKGTLTAVSLGQLVYESMTIDKKEAQQ